MTIQLALDHNFPEPLLRSVASWIPEVKFVWLREIHPDLPGLDDRQMIIALHQLGWAGLVTNNYKILRAPTELAALMKTKIGFFCIEGTGDDPIRASGALLLDLPGVLKDFTPGQGAIFRLAPRRPRPRNNWELFSESARRAGRGASDLYAEVRVSDEELTAPVLGALNRRTLRSRPRQEDPLATPRRGLTQPAQGHRRSGNPPGLPQDQET